MTQTLELLATWLGSLIGWARRQDTVSTALELTGGGCLVGGVASWDSDAGLIVLGLLLFIASWRWNRT